MNIVYLDNYDSFANTISAYFEMAAKKLDGESRVKMFKSDCNLDVVAEENPDLIILGPGPSSPNEAGNYLDAILCEIERRRTRHMENDRNIKIKTQGRRFHKRQGCKCKWQQCKGRVWCGTVLL